MTQARLPHFLLVFALVCCFGESRLIAQQDVPQVAEEVVAAEAMLIDASGLANQGDRAGAIALYEELLAKDPSNSAAAYSAARLYQADEQPEKALQLMLQGHRQDGDNEYITEALAAMLLEAGRHVEAAQAFAQLFAAQPAREEFLVSQARALSQAGKPRDGLRAIEKYLSGGGRLSPIVGQQRFTLAVSMNDAAAAVRALEELMAAYPRNADYHQELAQFYRRTGDEAAAQSVWRGMAERFPADSRAALGLAGQSKLTGEEEAFLTNLQPVFEDPSLGIDAKIMQLMPVVQEVAARSDTVLANRALPLARALVETHPDEAKAHAIYGDLLLQAHRNDEAVEEYRATLELDPGVFLVWEQLLLSLGEAGRYEELLKASDDALMLFPNQARLYYYNGRALERTGNLTAAESTLTEGIFFALDDQVLLFDLHTALARVRQREARHTEALESAIVALAIRPTYGPALALKAEVLMRSGDALGEAQEILAQAVGEDAQHPYVLTVEAYAQLLANDPKAAAQTITAALKYGAASWPIAQEVAGDIAYVNGDAAGAMQAWQRAKAMGGGSDTLAKKLAQGVYVK